MVKAEIKGIGKEPVKLDKNGFVGIVQKLKPQEGLKGEKIIFQPNFLLREIWGRRRD